MYIHSIMVASYVVLCSLRCDVHLSTIIVLYVLPFQIISTVCIYMVINSIFPCICYIILKIFYFLIK